MRARWRAGAALAVVLSVGGSADAFYFEGWPGSGLRAMPSILPRGQTQSQNPGVPPGVDAPTGPTAGDPTGPVDMPPVGPSHVPEPSAGLIGLIGLGALGLRRLRRKASEE